MGSWSGRTGAAQGDKGGSSPVAGDPEREHKQAGSSGRGVTWPEGPGQEVVPGLGKRGGRGRDREGEEGVGWEQP